MLPGNSSVTVETAMNTAHVLTYPKSHNAVSVYLRAFEAAAREGNEVEVASMEELSDELLSKILESMKGFSNGNRELLTEADFERLTTGNAETLNAVLEKAQIDQNREQGKQTQILILLIVIGLIAISGLVTFFHIRSRSDNKETVSNVLTVVNGEQKSEITQMQEDVKSTLTESLILFKEHQANSLTEIGKSITETQSANGTKVDQFLSHLKKDIQEFIVETSNNTTELVTQRLSENSAAVRQIAEATNNNSILATQLKETLAELDATQEQLTKLRDAHEQSQKEDHLENQKIRDDLIRLKEEIHQRELLLNEKQNELATFAAQLEIDDEINMSSFTDGYTAITEPSNELIPSDEPIALEHLDDEAIEEGNGISDEPLIDLQKTPLIFEEPDQTSDESEVTEKQ